MAASKQVLRGTHRAVPPETTWARVQPLLPAMGITRVAELTGLDVIGIPTFQAVRPNARTLSVSQGKGVTPALARASAVMECIELWHAENLPPAPVLATVAEMAPLLPYSVFDLPRPPRSVLSPHTRLSWAPATALDGARSVWVPQALVQLDFSPDGSWRLPVFHRSGTGLASGNTIEEAILHALYEVVERDGLQHAGPWNHTDADLDLGSVPAGSTTRWTLNRFAAADIHVRVRDLTPVTDLPCYEAEIWSHALPMRFGGAGCHRDPDVALSRALTEAAQSRLTLIAGTRDDIPDSTYQWFTSRARLRSPFPTTRPTVRFPATVPPDPGTFAEDLHHITHTVRKRTPHGVFWVDLTRPELGIPVVQVLAPGMKDKR